MEKAFEAIECRENQKVPFASFILEGKADTWWTSKRRMLEAGGNVVTWEQFKDAFYEQFFPDSVRFEKQQEFLSIHQGNRTVMEYDHHFTELAQFSPHIAFNESQRVRHFEKGLRSSIRKSIAVLILPTYAEVLNRALVVEKLDNELQQAKDRKRPFSAAPFTYGGSHSGPSKKGNGKQFGHQQARAPSNQVVIRCYFCGKTDHVSTSCPMGQRVCFYCQQPGHMSKDFPRKQHQRRAPPQTTGQQQLRPREEGHARVYALTHQDAEASGSIIKGIITLCGMPTSMLIDSSSTHSFISPYFAMKLHKNRETMNNTLMVVTPVGNSLIVDQIYRNCVITIESHDLLVDLILLEFQDFDAILGMDWLSAYHASVDCF